MLNKIDTVWRNDTNLYWKIPSNGVYRRIHSIILFTTHFISKAIYSASENPPYSEDEYISNMRSAKENAYLKSGMDVLVHTYLGSRITEISRKIIFNLSPRSSQNITFKAAHEF